MAVLTSLAWQALQAGEYQHQAAAVAEGLCPEHGTAMDPVPAPPGKIAGHCLPCHKYWGLNRDSEVSGWWLDHDPATGWPAAAVPGWMAWREEP